MQNAAQVVFVGATLPSNGSESVVAKVKKCFPGIQTVATRGAHQPAAPIKHRFISAPQGVDPKKYDAVEQVLFEASPDSLTLIFVNQHWVAEVVWAELLRRGHDVAMLHKRVELGDRLDTVARAGQGLIDVLVCTDLVARGLDFKNVDTVIQFDIAFDAMSYLHRAGRTGRMNRPGTVVSFTANHALSVAIEEAIERSGSEGTAGKAFEALFSRNRSLRNKERKLRLKASDGAHPLGPEGAKAARRDAKAGHGKGSKGGKRGNGGKGGQHKRPASNPHMITSQRFRGFKMAPPVVI